MDNDVDIFKKSIADLENIEWAECPLDLPPFLKDCHRYYYTKIGKLDIEGMRMLIGQDIGLEYLFPIAIDILEENPLVKGQYYSGDLLSSVLRVNKKFYKDHPEYKNRVISIILNLNDVMKKLNYIDFKYSLEGISSALLSFDESLNIKFGSE